MHIIGSVDPITGGPIEGILQQWSATQDLAVREIASLDVPGAPYLEGMPIPVHALGVDWPAWQRKALPWAYYRWTPRMIPWLRSNLDRFDWVVVNGLWNYSARAAAVALPASRVKYFVFTHGMIDPWFQRHAPVKHFGKQLSWLATEGPLLRHAQAVLFTSEEERRLARGQFWGEDYEQRVVGYGIAEPPAPGPGQAEALQAAVPGLKGRRFLLFLSRIHPKKGCDILVSAFARFASIDPDLQLIMAGPDQAGWTADLIAQAEHEGVGARIHWPGMLRGDAKWGAMRGAEAFVLPSHSENFGIVVAEAMACGLPVIITDKVNIWREIEGAGGFIASDDLDDYSRALSSFLSLATEEKMKMRRQAVETYRRHFHVAKAARNLFDLADAPSSRPAATAR